VCAVDFRSRFMLHDAVRSKDEAPASFRRMLTTTRSLGHTVQQKPEQQHITRKALKAVRHAVERLLPQPAGRNVLMHADNHAVRHIFTGPTSRSPVMMEEIRRL
jgi:hypothetical protein